ncbi:MAG: hypothetical protein PHD43_18540, partial [Methylococcales bacterium]|nr:hypothetical protein [Methylococcales bacterium]
PYCNYSEFNFPCFPMEIFRSFLSPGEFQSFCGSFTRVFKTIYTYKKIFPSLQAMVKRGRLDVPVIGVGRSDWTADNNRITIVGSTDLAFSVGDANDLAMLKRTFRRTRG